MIPLTIQKDKALLEKWKPAKRKHNTAELLFWLGNTFLYRVGLTTFMYLLNVIRAIVNIEAHAKICDVDPTT